MTSGQREESGAQQGGQRRTSGFPGMGEAAGTLGLGSESTAVAETPRGGGESGYFLPTYTRTSPSDLDSLLDSLLALTTVAAYVPHILLWEGGKKARAMGDTMSHYPSHEDGDFVSASRGRMLGPPGVSGRGARVKDSSSDWGKSMINWQFRIA